MRLDELIKKETDRIIDNWQKFAGTLGPSLGGRDSAELRDHIKEILDAILFEIASTRSPDEKNDKSKESGGESIKPASKVHAEQRFKEGFNINEMIAEYRALRISVLSEWASAIEGESNEQMTKFNETIDLAIAAGVERFTNALKQLNDQFIAILGHDLKNPLGAIITCVDFIRMSNNKIDADNEYVKVIKSSATRMTGLIDDLLDFARTSLGSSIPIARASMDLKEVCLAVIHELQVSNADRAFDFTAEGNLSGKWDKARLAQLISNLVGNAIQYGAPSQSINIKAKDVGESVVLEVHNAGEPIDPSKITQIFEPMYRSDPLKATSNLGLGLYIVREIVKSHHGTINVTSTEKAGTTFSVHLPRAA